MSGSGTNRTSRNVRSAVAIWGIVLQNYFYDQIAQQLIQERMQTGRIDSKKRSGGFDYCALATQQRVLQHNQGISRHHPTGQNRRDWPMCDIGYALNVAVAKLISTPIKALV
jgi:uncharacterized protein HemX